MENKKNILITGASKGIGKIIAKEFFDENYNLFLTSRNQRLLENSVKEISPAGYMVCDLSKPQELEKLAQFIKVKEIDILINNAGEYIYGGIEKMSYSKMNEMFSVNLLAPTYLCSAAVENMKQKNWGRIINIASISAVMGEAYASLYSASKAGLIGLTKSLALELAEFNITVNAINPGWVETELAKKSIEESEFSLEETLDIIPQKRFVEPEEVANLIKYLISQEAKGLTGQSINLCAGLSLGF